MKSQMKLTTILLALCFLFFSALASWAGTATMTQKKISVSSKPLLAKKKGLPDLIVSISTTAIRQTLNPVSQYLLICLMCLLFLPIHQPDHIVSVDS